MVGVVLYSYIPISGPYGTYDFKWPFFFFFFTITLIKVHVEPRAGIQVEGFSSFHGGHILNESGFPQVSDLQTLINRVLNELVRPTRTTLSIAFYLDLHLTLLFPVWSPHPRTWVQKGTTVKDHTWGSSDSLDLNLHKKVQRYLHNLLHLSTLYKVNRPMVELSDKNLWLYTTSAGRCPWEPDPGVL